jgi:hypothetical protein
VDLGLGWNGFGGVMGWFGFGDVMVGFAAVLAGFDGAYDHLRVYP